MSVPAEERRIRNLFERVETIEEVAETLPGGMTTGGQGSSRFPVTPSRRRPRSVL